MLKNWSSYKYKTPHKLPYEITQTFISGMCTLKIGETENILYICQNNPYRTNQYILLCHICMLVYIVLHIHNFSLLVIYIYMND